MNELINVNDIKNGMTVFYNGNICQIQSFLHVKPGKGAAIMKVKMRNLKTGTITEESSIMGFPAITVRQAHERPEGMDEGTLIMSGVESEDIIDSIEIVTNNKVIPHIVNDYNVEHVGIKVVKIIMSYTDYVNRTVWRK